MVEHVQNLLQEWGGERFSDCLNKYRPTYYLFCSIRPSSFNLTLFPRVLQTNTHLLTSVVAAGLAVSVTNAIAVTQETTRALLSVSLYLLLSHSV